MTNDMMQSFEFSDLLARHDAAGTPWMAFLRVPSLSAGVYRLAAGTVDPQKPHTVDEVYYVISGAGSFTCEGQTIPAVAGSTIYVAARASHRFHDITAGLTILVLFAPPEHED